MPERKRGKRRISRLAASAVALSVALALALGTAAALGASPIGGGAVGILVEKTEPAPGDPDPGEGSPPRGESALGVLVAPDAAGELAVSFWVAGLGEEFPAFEIEGLRSEVEYGALVARPADPAWPHESWPGKDNGADEPVFDAWYADAAGESRFDFSAPVSRETVLWARFTQDDPVTVVLDPAGGSIGGASGAVSLTRYPGRPYGSLPAPEKAGYVFGGWMRDGSPVGEGDVLPGDADLPETREVRLVAAWSPIEYRVRFAGAPSLGEPAVTWGPYYYGQDDPIVLPEPGDIGLSSPAGMRFVGWARTAQAVEGETVYRAGDELRDLVSAAPAPGAEAYADFYSRWVDGPPVDPEVEYGVSFDAGAGSFGGGASVVDVTVPKNGLLDEPEAPKRAGWQFAGWYLASEGGSSGAGGSSGEGGSSGAGNEGGGAGGGGVPEGFDPEGASKVPLGERWDFTYDAVTADVVDDAGTLTLHAKWDLRLDVTVPVSVGFAVDADTGEATGPGEGRYALKSRTVAEVVVERAALESRQKELEGFFEPRGAADAGAGAGEDGSGDDAWAAALADTRLSLGAGGETVSLPFAGESATVDGEAVWDSEHPLTDTERAAFRMDAFVYGGTAFDEAWQGGIPCEELPLKLGMTIPIDQLKVKTDLDGPQKVTRLILTVSAKA